MGNYLLNSDLQEELHLKLIGLKAVINLINKQTSIYSETENNDVNSASFLVAEGIESIITELENLPFEGSNEK